MQWEWSLHRRGEMIRPAEQYRQIADNIDRLALNISDQALRSLYLDFAQQWRDIAARAEDADQMAAMAPAMRRFDCRSKT